MLPDNLSPGTYLLEVLAEDMFGRTHRGSWPLRVTA